MFTFKNDSVVGMSVMNIFDIVFELLGDDILKKSTKHHSG